MTRTSRLRRGGWALAAAVVLAYLLGTSTRVVRIDHAVSGGTQDGYHGEATTDEPAP